MNITERAEEIFSEALSIAPSGRQAFLDERCDKDPALLAEVRSLLKSHGHASSFLEDPVMRVFTTSNGVPSIVANAAHHLGQQLGPYTLTMLLGRGGCGLVYLARQIRPVRREVAVKILHPGAQSADVLARFDLERQALVLTNHPNIAALFDAGETPDGQPYFVMEYVRGLPLTQHCDKKALGKDARLALFTMVCQAVQHAHQRGIIHRDLKPGNILVAETDDGDQPKVIDFGIAKLQEGPLRDQAHVTQAGMLIGTPDYMSPEQLSGKPGVVDARSDVYALGVILYEMLTGVRPFDLSQMSLAEAQGFVRDRPTPRASTTLSRLAGQRASTVALRDLRGDLDWIVHKAMDKEAEKRYQSVSELAADIQRHLRREPVEAGPPSSLYRFRKFVARHKGASIAAVTVAIALLGATVVSTLSARRAWRAESNSRTLAERNERIAYRTSILAADSNIGRDIRVAYRALEEAPKPLRDWEWHYLQSRCDLAPVFYSSDGTIASAAATTTGSLIAIGMHSGKILLWNHHAGDPRVLSGHEQRVHSLDFSRDGTRLASGSSDGDVRLWDTRDGTSRVIGSHGKGVASVAFSADGASVASGGADGTARVWSLDGKERWALECSTAVYSVTFVGDGDQLATGSQDGRIQVWSLKDGSRVQGWVAAAKGVRCLVNSGHDLIAGSLDGSLCRWNGATGELITTYRKAGGPDVKSVAASADGSLIAVGDAEGETSVLDRDSGRQTAQLAARGQYIQGVAFAGGPSNLIAATWGGTARLWRIGPAEELKPIHLGHGQARSLEFHADSRHLMGATAKGRVSTWDMWTGREVSSLQLSAESGSTTTTRARWATQGTASGKVQLWRTDSGELAAEFDAGSHINATGSSRDGALVAAGCESGAVVVWNSLTGARIGAYHGGSGCTALEVSPDGSFVAAGFREGAAVVWNLANPPPSEPSTAWGKPVESIAISADGSLVAFGLQESPDATIHVLRTSDCSPVCSAGGTGFGVSSLAFSPSGHRVASGGNSNAVRIWSIPDGEELLTVRELAGNAAALAFSKDGRSLAISTNSGRLYVVGRPQHPLGPSARPASTQGD